jgi:hypothetical protein
MSALTAIDGEYLDSFGRIEQALASMLVESRDGLYEVSQIKFFLDRVAHPARSPSILVPSAAHYLVFCEAARQ